MEFNWWLAIVLFFASILLDAVFALYTVAVIKSQPFKTASMSVLCYLIAAVGVVNYVQNKWYLIPLSAGAFVGSYVIVKREANKKTKK